MHDLAASPLGKPSPQPTRYDPGLLCPIARAAGRAELGLDPAAPLPFRGVDIWNAYELSWLDARGKPIVAVAELRVPATSPNLVESKSLKLYLNSLNQERLGTADAVAAVLARDLSACAGEAVDLSLIPSGQYAPSVTPMLAGDVLDGLELELDDYGPPNPGYLAVGPEERRAVRECLVSHLLRSNCPVTGQPDWASIEICYRGRRIERAGLLRYLVSFRRHAAFHEQCVERIFLDVLERCAPLELSVYARYTRRGGIDINPWRANFDAPGPINARLARQ